MTTMRAKLTAKHPRPTDTRRAPIRPGAPRPPRDKTDDARAAKPAGKRPGAARSAGGARETADRRPAGDRPPRPADASGTRRALANAVTRIRQPVPAADAGEQRFSRSGEPGRAHGTDRSARGEGRAPVRQAGLSAAHAAAPAVNAREADDDGAIRLSKRMSELGLCSRREADEWIEKGWVRVDGKVTATLGSKIRPDQHIEIAPAARAMQARQVTIVLHKPMGYVSGQPEDDHLPAVALVTPDNRWEEDEAHIGFQPQHLRSLAPAGRLDIDSTGLLILTQDGRVARQLIGENSEVDKEYLVRVRYGGTERDVQAQFPADRLALLNHGLSLDDQPLRPAVVEWLNGEQLRFVLREGKKRQIRRMCELVGLEVTGLKRIRIGTVMLGALPPGKWRYLRDDESF
jgi:23S rRNA pseudouridine2604 synthase